MWLDVCICLHACIGRGAAGGRNGAAVRRAGPAHHPHALPSSSALSAQGKVVAHIQKTYGGGGGATGLLRCMSGFRCGRRLRAGPRLQPALGLGPGCIAPERVCANQSCGAPPASPHRLARCSNFLLTFPQGATPEDKALLLAALIHVEYQVGAA